MTAKKRPTPVSTKIQKIKSFDPNAPGQNDANIFGLPFTCEEADIVLVPVPWEATVSYGGGTAEGPAAILSASAQVDLFHVEFPTLWRAGIAMDEIPSTLLKKSKVNKKNAGKIIEALENGTNVDEYPKLKALRDEVNESCEEMISAVEKRTEYFLRKGKLVGLVGGDHSTPLGFFKALAKQYKNFGILQIDAHADLRKAFEGFTYSHASIMYNTMQQVKQVSKLVQLGIRDSCDEEEKFVVSNSKRIKVFPFAEIRKQQYEGLTWKQQCKTIIDALPEYIHISFDIDGLDPKLCPNTGTPVPGGFEFHEMTYLLSEIAKSKKKIISFDLNEVSPGKDDWDGNVGARLLFHLCGVLAKSNGII